MKQPAKKPVIKKKKSPVEYEQQIGELTAHLQRLQAEFENYKKREASEKSELLSTAKAAVLSELLPALDNFDRAATHLPQELENNSWAKGMQYVGQQLLDILENMGISSFRPLGEKFDHSKHEALEHIESDKPPETIVEVLTPGYKMGENVIRPATVKVSSGNNKQSLENNKKEKNNG
jgi:molecular chaperone GrpE